MKKVQKDTLLGLISAAIVVILFTGIVLTMTGCAQTTCREYSVRLQQERKVHLLRDGTQIVTSKEVPYICRDNKYVPLQ